MAITPSGNRKKYMKTKPAKREGLALRFKRLVKKLARNAVVKRWLLVAVLKIVGWLIKRFWSDDHPNLSS